MKLLLIYIHPSQQFQGENKILINLQIDNLLDLGWDRDDVYLVTNFDYEYREIRSLVVTEDTYCDFIYQNSKVFTIAYLFRTGLFNGDDLIWMHDLDVYQCEPITEEELGLNDFDMGMTDYGTKPIFNMGSIFFNERARDIFKNLKGIIEAEKILDETALKILNANSPGLENRIKKLNITYNLQPFNLKRHFGLAIKPIRAVHFHPNVIIKHVEVNTLDYFIRRKNKLGNIFIDEPIMPDRLVKIFNHYGYN